MLVGFPIKEYYLCKEDDASDCIWISNELLNYYLDRGYHATGDTRMSYAAPQWVPKDINPNGTILLLDDFNRANPNFIQATMELINTGSYISWTLPDNCQILMSSNPDDGDYNVTSMDNAQRTRYISFNLGFDIKPWAEWAEVEKIDDRAINFMLQYHREILERKKGESQTINPRSLVTFFNTISGIKDYSTPASLALIMQIAQGCFTSKENIVGRLFTTFVNNKLDKLITAEDMLHKDWKYVKGELERVLYTGPVTNPNNYRADIAAILVTRFLNYTISYFKQEGSKTDVVINRVLNFVEMLSEDKDGNLKFTVRYFSEDSIYYLVKQLNLLAPARLKKLVLHPTIIKILLPPKEEK